MPDDQVTIDPEFQPPSPDGGQGSWLRLAGVVAVVVAAFIFGWLLRSPAPTEPEAVEAAVTSTTALTGETTTSTTRSRPSSTTSTTVAEIVELGVPLGEAVRGFTDTIMMTHWDEERNGVLRWRASQTGPEKIASFDQGEDEGWFVGLDASGRWAAQVTYSGLLTVHPVPEIIDQRWPEGFDQAVDVRVASAVWHDSDPGRLAWVKCSRSVEDTDDRPLGVATLYSFDMTATDPSEPVAEFTIDGGCVGERWGVFGPQLLSWGDWGTAFVSGPDWTSFLLDASGAEVARFEDSDTRFIATTPDGSAVWTEWSGSHSSGAFAESFVYSSDGQRRSPVPGLADDEWLDHALWSPDGSYLALFPRRIVPLERIGVGDGRRLDDPSVRIIEAATGTIVGEISEPARDVWPIAWSTDGRFLLLDQIPSQGIVDAKELVFYDTETGSTVAIPMPIEIGDFRTVEPVPVTEMFTPVEWGIAPEPDEADPGAHGVSMIVAVLLGPGDSFLQVEEVSGTLVWNETVVDLCRIEIRHVGDGFVHIGDIFGTIEGCGANPTAMQDAFNEFGLPETACLAARVDGVDYEYCAPLS